MVLTTAGYQIACPVPPKDFLTTVVLRRNGKATCFAYGQTGSGKTYTMGVCFSTISRCWGRSQLAWARDSALLHFQALHIMAAVSLAQSSTIVLP